MHTKSLSLGIIAAALLLGLAAAMIYVNLQSSMAPHTGGIMTGTYIRAMSTSTARAVGTGHNKLLLATSTPLTRQYALITNLGTGYVCLEFNDRPATDCNGVYLQAGGSYEISQNNLYAGAIRAIANTATSTVTIIEYKPQ